MLSIPLTNILIYNITSHPDTFPYPNLRLHLGDNINKYIVFSFFSAEQ